MRLAAENLSVMLGARRALDNVSVALDGGAPIGLIGPNGAGKTTLLRALAGLLPPTLGKVSLDGRPLAEAGSAAARPRDRLSAARRRHPLGAAALPNSC